MECCKNYDNFNKNRRFLQGKEDNREMVFFFKIRFTPQGILHRKQHFSNRHSVPLISNRTHSASSPISHFFPSVSLNFLLHATSSFPSRFVTFGRSKLPSFYRTFYCYFFSHSASHGKTGNEQTVKLFNSDSIARVRIEREIFALYSANNVAFQVFKWYRETHPSRCIEYEYLKSDRSEIDSSDFSRRIYGE